MKTEGNDKRRLTNGDRLLDVSKDILKQEKRQSKALAKLEMFTLLHKLPTTRSKNRMRNRTMTLQYTRQ